MIRGKSLSKVQFEKFDSALVKDLPPNEQPSNIECSQNAEINGKKMLLKWNIQYWQLPYFKMRELGDFCMANDLYKKYKEAS